CDIRQVVGVVVRILRQGLQDRPRRWGDRVRGDPLHSRRGLSVLVLEMDFVAVGAGLPVVIVGPLARPHLLVGGVEQRRTGLTTAATSSKISITATEPALRDFVALHWILTGSPEMNRTSCGAGGFGSSGHHFRAGFRALPP